MRGLTRMSLPPFPPEQQSTPPPQRQVQPPHASCGPPDSPAHMAQSCAAKRTDMCSPAACAMFQNCCEDLVVACTFLMCQPARAPLVHVMLKATVHCVHLGVSAKPCSGASRLPSSWLTIWRAVSPSCSRSDTAPKLAMLDSSVLSVSSDAKGSTCAGEMRVRWPWHKLRVYTLRMMSTQSPA